VLVAGGLRDGIYLRSAEVYDPSTGRWSRTDPMSQARAQATATLLPDGRVLVAAGYDGDLGTNTAELFESAAGR